MTGTAQSEPGVVTMGNDLCLQSGIWIVAFFCVVFLIVFFREDYKPTPLKTHSLYPSPSQWPRHFPTHSF